MRSSTFFFALSALAGFVSAQDSSNTTTCCTIDPGSVPVTTRNEWCLAQRNTCPELCGGIGKLKTGGNTCDVNTLEFNCECSNGVKPNMSDYQQSLPGQQCREWFTQCIDSHPNDKFGQAECEAVQCGNKTAKPLSEQTSSAAPSSTPSSTGSQPSTSASASAPAAAASSSGAAVALGLAREFGTPALAAGILAAFGLAL